MSALTSQFPFSRVAQDCGTTDVPVGNRAGSWCVVCHRATTIFDHGIFGGNQNVSICNWCPHGMVIPKLARVPSECLNQMSKNEIDPCK